MTDDLDDALLKAARVGLFAERAGTPLLPWQQRVVDRMVVDDSRRRRLQNDPSGGPT